MAVSSRGGFRDELIPLIEQRNAITQGECN
jgi:hypothetical protein